MRAPTHNNAAPKGPPKEKARLAASPAHRGQDGPVDVAARRPKARSAITASRGDRASDALLVRRAPAHSARDVQSGAGTPLESRHRDDGTAGTRCRRPSWLVVVGLRRRGHPGPCWRVKPYAARSCLCGPPGRKGRALPPASMPAPVSRGRRRPASCRGFYGGERTVKCARRATGRTPSAVASGARRPAPAQSTFTRARMDAGADPQQRGPGGAAKGESARRGFTRTQGPGWPRRRSRTTSQGKKRDHRVLAVIVVPTRCSSGGRRRTLYGAPTHNNAAPEGPPKEKPQRTASSEHSGQDGRADVAARRPKARSAITASRGDRASDALLVRRAPAHSARDVQSGAGARSTNRVIGTTAPRDAVSPSELVGGRGATSTRPSWPLWGG